MCMNLIRNGLLAAVLVGAGALPLEAQNQETNASPGSGAAPPNAAHPAPAISAAGEAGQGWAAPPAAPPAAASSVEVDNLLKLLQSGVSKDVIRAYIETSAAVPQLSAADIVRLKERGLPDDLTLALMKRRVQLLAQATQANASNAVPTNVTGSVSLDALIAALQRRQVSGGGLDPEGYDYFRYYYLTPRAIASANEQIFSSYRALPGYGPYGFGYRLPGAFGPYPLAPRFPGP